MKTLSDLKDEKGKMPFKVKENKKWPGRKRGKRKFETNGETTQKRVKSLDGDPLAQSTKTEGATESKKKYKSKNKKPTEVPTSARLITCPLADIPYTEQLTQKAKRTQQVLKRCLRQLRKDHPSAFPTIKIGRAVQQECRDRSRMPSSA
eukprot:TRINITY_DN81881_c0_g1_i1.p1 TRINITY_DN81881_c0_g1~~TRINITY_DN81881_c0_g1_i1.p1  ORF type:complete len:166 (-),score=37.08 TRINITY_DN81881_c0_g1_i1:10-456(-)